MVEVLVVCEGSTEREFCREVVGPLILPKGISLAGTLVGKPHQKKGGISPWQSYRRELVRLAKERDARHVAVLVDYYGMPGDWPGRTASRSLPVLERGAHVEKELVSDLDTELPGRFHPCIQLHEFESLLFADPELSALSIAIGSGLDDESQLADDMHSVKQECGGSAELIDDGPETAPSKRLIALVPGYDKVAWGVTAAKDVPIEVLRRECSWLDRWVTRLACIG